VSVIAAASVKTEKVYRTTRLLIEEHMEAEVASVLVYRMVDSPVEVHTVVAYTQAADWVAHMERA
jgi:hypothetical protein